MYFCAAEQTTIEVADTYTDAAAAVSTNVLDASPGAQATASAAATIQTTLINAIPLSLDYLPAITRFIRPISRPSGVSPGVSSLSAASVEASGAANDASTSSVTAETVPDPFTRSQRFTSETNSASTTASAANGGTARMESEALQTLQGILVYFVMIWTLAAIQG